MHRCLIPVVVFFGFVGILPGVCLAQTQDKPEIPNLSPATQAAAPSDARSTVGPATNPAAEPATQPTSQPASQPAEPENPLRKPRTMMTEFLRAVSESEQKPERMADAVRCLDLSRLTKDDPKAAEEQGPLLAKQLSEIIDVLLNTYGKNLDEIPKNPRKDKVSFPQEGAVRLEFVRAEGDGLWRFSADTVATIPQKLEAVKKREQQKEKEAPQPKLDVKEEVPVAFRTPRATMKTFLEAMAKGDKTQAAGCLDLSGVPAAVVAETGAKLADQLLFVMDRIAVVVYQGIPDRPDGDPYVWFMTDQGRIELARAKSGKSKGRWLFSEATVNSIEPLFKAYQDKPRLAELQRLSFWNNPRQWLLNNIPLALHKSSFGVQRWQWLCVGILLILGYVIHRATLFVLFRIARPFGRTRDVELLPGHVRDSLRPLAVLVMLATWWGGLQLLLIPMHLLAYVWQPLKFVMTSVAVWAFYRLIDLVADFFATRAARTSTRLDEVLIPLVRKTAKIIVVAVGLVCIIQALGAEPETINKLFAGLGIGGLAFALAAQESLKNFFGSITVVLDRPFQVGDWVKVGETEGLVESVGLRSSRIRTFYNSEVTIPNADLTTATIDNLGRRRYRRICCKISVLYSTTPEQLEAFCEGIRELIRRHPFTRKDYYNVWVNEFAASSIDILLYCFHETPDWSTELRERHRLFLDIIRLARRLGVDFAFPTQTIHLARADESSQPERRVEAAEPAHLAPAASESAANRQGANDPLAWGRQEAERIARQTIGDPSKISPKFEFPSVE